MLYRQLDVGKLTDFISFILVGFFFRFIEFHSRTGMHKALNDSALLEAFPLDSVHKNNITLFLNILWIFSVLSKGIY